MDQDIPNPAEPTLNDIGTRYEHLKEHYEALEAVANRLQARNALSVEDKQRLIKLTIAAEVTKQTLDAFLGLSGANLEYMMYRIVKSVPKNADDIPSERGTPLC